MGELRVFGWILGLGGILFVLLFCASLNLHFIRSLVSRIWASGSMVLDVGGLSGGGAFWFGRRIFTQSFCLLETIVLVSITEKDDIWSSWAPSKVIVFSLPALLGRLPTRVNLVLRGVILVEDSSCVFCDLSGESKNHLFASCSLAWSV
jgi:hypothetical protein